MQILCPEYYRNKRLNVEGRDRNARTPLKRKKTSATPVVTTLGATANILWLSVVENFVKTFAKCTKGQNFV
jgi:hypothetical protein